MGCCGGGTAKEPSRIQPVFLPYEDDDYDQNDNTKFLAKLKDIDFPEDSQVFSCKTKK